MRKLNIEELKRINIDQFKASEKIPLIIILDNVRSQNNIGSIFRTADAFRIEKIILCGISATPPNKEIHKTALGAEDSVIWQYYPTTLEAVETIKKDLIKVYAVEQAEKSTDIRDFMPEKGKITALILGNEVEGVSDEVMDIVDGCIEIPQYGTKHSLNVSITGGIVIYDYFIKINM